MNTTTPSASLTESDLRVGHIYRAKRPAKAGSLFDPLVNDRSILHIGMDSVQYDSPSVANGRRYPAVTKSAFLKWAGRDVTDQMPEGEWAKWGDAK